MTIEGVDFANERPGGSALAKAGKHFAIRYLSPNTPNNPGKRITTAEIASYRNAGLDLGFVWETTVTRAEAGHAAGVADAKAAEQVRKSLGVPSVPLFFAVDTDTSGAKVADYFRGVASVIGLSRTGAYGSYRVTKYLFDNKLVTWGWQTYAWSAGLWDHRAQVQQYHNGVKVAGMPLDLCRATVGDWGQWSAPSAHPSQPAQPTEDDMQLTDPVKLPDGFSTNGTDVGHALTYLMGAALASNRSLPAILAAVAKGEDVTALAAKLAPALATALVPLLPAGATVTPDALQAAVLGAFGQMAAASLDLPTAG
jgi:hypothetical protein